LPVPLQADGFGDAEGLAGRHVTDHDLLAGRRRLAGAHMAVQQHEEGVSVFALLEHRRVLGDPYRAGLAQDRTCRIFSADPPPVPVIGLCR